MSRKTEIIETLQMSIRIANDAVNSLKMANAIKSSDNVKLKVRNIELTEVNRSIEKLYDDSKIKIGQLNEEIAENQIKYDDLHDLYEQTKEDRDTSEKEAVLKEVNKPRTYFEIASSDPLKLFEVGEVVHIISVDGLVHNTKVSADTNNELHPLKVDGGVFTKSGRSYYEDVLRCLFTTAEMIEMGYEIPDLE